MFPPITRRWPMRNSAKWNEPIKNWIFFFHKLPPTDGHTNLFIHRRRQVLRQPMDRHPSSAQQQSSFGYKVAVRVCVLIPRVFPLIPPTSVGVPFASAWLPLTSFFFWDSITNPSSSVRYDWPQSKKIPYNSFRTQVPPVGLDRDTVRMLMKFDTI